MDTKKATAQVVARPSMSANEEKRVSLTTKVTVVLPSEPQIDLTLTGIKNIAQKGDVLQVTIPLSLLKTLMAEITAALTAAGVPLE
jgi:hypothetical protein